MVQYFSRTLNQRIQLQRQSTTTQPLQCLDLRLRGVTVDVQHLRPQNGDSSDICVIEMEVNLVAETQSSKTATTQI